MPRKPTLSPTKITTYLACPLKYRWTYVDAIGKRYMRAKHYYSFGSTLHRVLERFHNAGDIGVQTVSQAVTAVEKDWVAAGFESKEQEQQALQDGRQIVESYVAHSLEAPKVTVTLFLEKMLRTNMGEFDLIGRVDRVEEHSDGIIEIIDYKSGRTEVSAEDVASDIAMSCYQLMIKRIFPDRKVLATILALRTGSRATVSTPDTQLEEFSNDIKTLGAEILSQDWPETFPSSKPICLNCDFVPLCIKHEEFKETYGKLLGEQQRKMLH